MLAVVMMLGASPAVAEPESLHPIENFGLEGTIPDLQGKIVLVDFWASWCGPCAKSFPALDSLYKEYRDRGFVVLGVSVDEEKSAMDRFLKKRPVSFPVVRDASHKLVSEVRAEAMPTSLLLDRAGRIQYRHSGFHGDKTIAELREQIDKLLGDS